MNLYADRIFQRQAKEFWDHLPVDLRDQIGAASKDLAGRIRAQGGSRMEWEELPRGLVDRYDECVLWTLEGRVRSCDHFTPRAPAPATLLLAASYHLQATVIACGTCAQMFFALVAEDPVENFACDGCRKYSRDLHLSCVTMGAFLVMAGLCRRCVVPVGEEVA